LEWIPSIHTYTAKLGALQKIRKTLSTSGNQSLGRSVENNCKRNILNDNKLEVPKFTCSLDFNQSKQQSSVIYIFSNVLLMCRRGISQANKTTEFEASANQRQPRNIEGDQLESQNQFLQTPTEDSNPPVKNLQIW